MPILYSESIGRVDVLHGIHNLARRGIPLPGSLACAQGCQPNLARAALPMYRSSPRPLADWPSNYAPARVVVDLRRRPRGGNAEGQEFQKEANDRQLRLHSFADRVPSQSARHRGAYHSFCIEDRRGSLTNSRLRRSSSFCRLCSARAIRRAGLKASRIPIGQRYGRRRGKTRFAGGRLSGYESPARSPR